MRGTRRSVLAISGRLGTKIGLVRLVSKGITGKEPSNGPLSGFGATPRFDRG